MWGHQAMTSDVWRRLSRTSWILMATTATGSKTRWAPQARRKACLGWSLAAACGVQGPGISWRPPAYSMFSYYFLVNDSALQRSVITERCTSKMSPCILYGSSITFCLRRIDMSQSTSLNHYHAPPLGRSIMWCASDVCLSVAYIGPESRTERPRKTKIVTEVAYVTRDSDTTFKIKKSKVKLQA